MCAVFWRRVFAPAIRLTRLGAGPAPATTLALRCFTVLALLAWDAQVSYAQSVNPRSQCLARADTGIFRRDPDVERFRVKLPPAPNTNADQIKLHFIYSTVLTRYLTNELSSVSLRQCVFVPAVDASFDLEFEPLHLNADKPGTCSINQCAGWLSDILKSSAPNPQKFAKAATEVANALTRADVANTKYSRVTARRAALEAYRNIYPVGSNEQILLGLSAEDFRSIEVSDFANWLKQQQFVSRKKESPVLAESLPVSCGNEKNLTLREINLRREGWGHQSIILINHAYERSGINSLNNRALRQLCHPNVDVPAAAVPQQWHDMQGQILCAREHVNKDRWLLLFANNSSSRKPELEKFAAQVAETFRADSCINPDLQIYVVKFLDGVQVK